MVTLAEAKAYIQVSGNTYDGLITDIISYVTAEIENYLNNKITPVTTKTDEPMIFLNGETEWVAPAFPISNVTVKYDGQALTDEEDYYLNPKAGVVYFPQPPETSTSKYTVTYTYGYSIANVPQAIKSVALKAIKALFDENRPSDSPGGGSGNITSKKIGDFSVTYSGSGGGELTGQAYIVQDIINKGGAVLNPYRRVILF
jgi:hypothetical protein